MNENVIMNSKSLKSNSFNNTINNPKKFWLIYIIFLFFLGTIHYSFEIQFNFKNLNFWITIIPSIIGTTTALGAIPFIIALFRLIFRKKTTKGIFTLYFTISIIFFFLTFFAMLYRVYSSDENHHFRKKQYNYNTKNLETDNYIYKKPNIEFIVKFQNKPNISISTFPIMNHFMESEIAELVLPKYQSFVRAECFCFDNLPIENMNRDRVINILKNYSDYNGLSFPTFSYEENKLGKIGSLKAYKTLLDDFGNERKVTYVLKIYSGKKSVMILYAGCPSEFYPTPCITEFYNSIAKY